MIVLERFDPLSRRAQFREIEGSADAAAPDRRCVDEQLARLGVTDLNIVEPSSDASVDEGRLDHRWELREGHLEYEACFGHASDAGGLVSLYTPIALATYGSDADGALTQVRLAIYEMCMNIFDHGRVRKADATVRLRLRFTSDAIEGWIQDECEAFNPLKLPLVDVKDHIRGRARRGYGLMMVRLLLDELHHEYNETGNRLHFTKRINS